MRSFHDSLSGITLGIGVILLLMLSAGTTLGSQSASATINDLAWNYDGTQLAVGRLDGTIEVMSVIGQSNFTLDTSATSIVSLAWSPTVTNSLAFSVLHYGDVKLINITADSMIVSRELATHQNYIRQVAWSPDGSLLATVGETGEGATSESAIKIWDAHTGDVIATYLDGYGLTEIAWNPQDANKLVITGTENHIGAEIVLWDVTNQAVIWNLTEPDSGVLNVAWNPDGSTFVTANNLEGVSTVRVHSATTGAEIAEIPTSQFFVGEISWHPGSKLAISGSDAIEIWDVSTLQMINTIQPPDFGTQLALSINNSLAYDNESEVILINVG